MKRVCCFASLSLSLSLVTHIPKINIVFESAAAIPMQANIVITYYLDVESFIFSFDGHAVKLNCVGTGRVQLLTAI